MARSLLSWAPAAGAVVVVAAAAIGIPMSASASAALPTKSAHQVLEMVASSKVDAFSGTITQTSNLGLPSLPSSGPGSDSSLASTLSLLTGSHSVRVYADGPTRQRVQLLDTNEEKDVVRNGNSVWTWDFTANKAEHIMLPTHTSKRKSAPGAAETPARLASKLLSALSSSSTVAASPSTITIAGRSYYELVLTPKASDTLLGSVTIDVDSATGLPLGVDITARGAKNPAFSIGFTRLTLGAPAASLFTFTPPAGAKVTQVTPHAHPKRTAAGPSVPRSSTPGHPTSKPSIARPKFTGTGWDAVATIAAAASLAKFESSQEFALMTTSVTGGRLFHTSLVNILFESDGRVLVGSVSAARLEAVAAAS